MTAAGREDVLRVDGERILVRDVGQGPPVLLINGIGAHTAMWQVLENSLRGFRVISFDAPGTGRSSTPKRVISVPRLARLVIRVLDHFGIEQADAVGYSMGGIVLQQLCADAPQRVRRAVLVATSPGIGAVYSSTLAMLNIGTPLRYLSDGLYRKTIGSLAGGRARNDPDWVSEHGAVRLRYKPSIRGYTKQLLALSTWSGLPLLGGIPHPVLVVAGDDDPLTPVANAQMMVHFLPNGRLLLIRGEGHLMLLDRDSAALSPIRRFLEADDLAEEAVWRNAETVDAATLRRALAGKQLQIQPWPFGLVSSYQRHRWLTSSK